MADNTEFVHPTTRPPAPAFGFSQRSLPGSPGHGSQACFIRFSQPRLLLCSLAYPLCSRPGATRGTWSSIRLAGAGPLWNWCSTWLRPRRLGSSGQAGSQRFAHWLSLLHVFSAGPEPDGSLTVRQPLTEKRYALVPLIEASVTASGS